MVLSGSGIERDVPCERHELTSMTGLPRYRVLEMLREIFFFQASFLRPVSSFEYQRSVRALCDSSKITYHFPEPPNNNNSHPIKTSNELNLDWYRSITAKLLPEDSLNDRLESPLFGWLVGCLMVIRQGKSVILEGRCNILPLIVQPQTEPISVTGVAVVFLEVGGFVPILRAPLDAFCECYSRVCGRVR